MLRWSIAWMVYTKIKKNSPLFLDNKQGKGQYKIREGRIRGGKNDATGGDTCPKASQPKGRAHLRSTQSLLEIEYLLRCALSCAIDMPARSSSFGSPGSSARSPAQKKKEAKRR